MKVLIIDDESLIRSSLHRVFAKNGFEVKSAEDGRAGLDLWETFEPDVVFIDWVMPNMNGKQVLESQVIANSSARVFVMSAYMNEASEDAFKALPVEMFVAKPFKNVLSLVQLVREGTYE